MMHNDTKSFKPYSLILSLREEKSQEITTHMPGEQSLIFRLWCNWAAALRKFTPERLKSSQ